MKSVNINSFIQAFNELSGDLFNAYAQMFGIGIKQSEIHDLESLVNEMTSIRPRDFGRFDQYYVGYTIPQISREFDLLRFGKNDIINIELKRESTEDKIKRQLVRNKYYLEFLGKTVFNYSYVSCEKQLYRIDSYNSLVQADMNELCQLLADQELEEITDIAKLFDPSNYLVSPFNSTEKFIDDEYFLTNQQEEIKNAVINDLTLKEILFFSIRGKAGTGKSLLAYDIAKVANSIGFRTLVIHCGNLNNGHYKLIGDFGWEIIPVKHWANYILSDYSLVVIDETQRIIPYQLSQIIKGVKNAKGNCVFAYDNQQTLKLTEANNQIEQQIIGATNPKIFDLTEKIRTNEEIASFIRCIFNKSRPFNTKNKGNIELTYFKNILDARRFLEVRRWQGWKLINYTPSTVQQFTYDEYHVASENSTHDVVGQEFDKVVAVVDRHFCYVNNALQIKDYAQRPYYSPTKMLFQIMTRTRKKLSVVVIDNPELMERCLSILQA